MKAADFKVIETIIQYEFKNKKLLEQAFMVQPVADNDVYSSEAFRIPGKRAINYALTHMILAKKAENSAEGFRLLGEKDEVNFILDNLYSRDIYARNIQVLGLAEYLDIPDEESYEDMTRRLFESLVGAVTIDSDWNLKVIEDFVAFILDVDFYLENGFESFDKHYVIKIYNWCAENNKSFPVYKYSTENNAPICQVKFGNAMITGRGASKTIAKFDAAAQVYKKLVDAGFIVERDKDGYVLGEPKVKETEAVDYLDNMALQGKISLPNYNTIEEDNDLFVTICQIDEVDRQVEAKGTSEKDSRNKAAYRMVKYILGYRIDAKQ